LTVASPYATFEINPGQIALPTDIGDKTVVIQIKSLLYEGTVTAVNISF
jgi:hypothetical protein